MFTHNNGPYDEKRQRTPELHDAAAHGGGPELPIYLGDSNSLWDQLRGQTTEHADPPRLEDEGQSGG
jgi:hypothetical protein